VFVRSAHEPVLSPHVVDLKDTGRDKLLQNVEVFREKLAKTVENQSVDFADLIRTQRPRVRIGKKKAFYVLPIKETHKEYTATTKQVETADIEVLPTNSSNNDRSSKRARRWEFSTFTNKSFAYTAVALILLMAIPYPVLGYIQDVKADSARIIAVSTHGFGALKDSTLAAFTADIDTAEDSLVEALSAFSEATQIIDGQHRALKAVATAIPILGPQVTGRETMLAAGHHVALGNTYLVKGATAAQSPEDIKLTERLRILESHLASALVQYDAALTSLASIPDSSIPKEYRSSATEVRLLFATFVDDMHDLSDLIHMLRGMLGDTGLKRYLVMFQNHQELRPTGGFMGSYAVLNVQKGTLDWTIPGGGTYDVQGQLTLNYEPPLPLQLMNSKWELQDANWWSHVPASAAVIEEMYENARGTTVDGVFFINATVLERLVSILGSVEHDAFATAADATSIIDDIESAKQTYQVEEHAPKAILGELVPVLLTALESLDGQGLLRILVETQRALSEKEVQLYVHDEQMQSLLRTYGWTGEIAVTKPDQDYLHIVRTNLQGQKSDSMIDESIHLSTEIQADGSVVHTLDITRTHTGTVGTPLSGVANISYIRTYVPEGSTLLTATGFEFPPEAAFKVPSIFALSHPLLMSLESVDRIDNTSGTVIEQSFGKTVFGNWMIVEPGETQTIRLTYALPFQLTPQMQTDKDSGEGVPYTLMHQKQSGTMSEYEHTITFPTAWDVAWVSKEDMDVGGNFVSFTGTFRADYYYGMVFRTTK
jgi:hypothetical protein